MSTMNTSITDRAAQVLREIAAALAMAANLPPERWETDREAKRPAVFTEAGDFIGGDMTPDNAAFIAASRTGYPLSLRCLKTAIDGLLRAYKYKSEHNRNGIGATLTTLCDQWRVAK